jgi:hypothetical protein
MSKKNKNETIKKAKVPDTEYSGNLNPSATSRLKKAGYGKSMDLELADIGKNQAKNEAEIYYPGQNTEHNAKVIPETSIIQPDDAKINHEFEFGNMGIQNNPVNFLRNAEDTRLNAELAGEFAGYKMNGRKEIENQNFEFGDIDKKNKLPVENRQNNKFKNNPNQ